MKVLVTGATSGIGYSYALKLIKNGHFVYLCVHNNEEVKTVIEKVKSINYLDRLSVIKLDITNFKDRKKVMKLDIDCLVSFAATSVGGSLLNMDVNDIRKNFEVNFFSTLELIKTYIETRNNKKGRVIIVSSIAGNIPVPFLGSYCSSKAALSIFISCLKKEMKKSILDFKIKLIEPGTYKTGFNQFMIDSKNDLSSKFFSSSMSSISAVQRKLFSFIEYKDLSSIVNKIYKATVSDNNKLVYRAPFSQLLFLKLYLFFVK